MIGNRVYLVALLPGALLSSNLGQPILDQTPRDRIDARQAEPALAVVGFDPVGLEPLRRLKLALEKGLRPFFRSFPRFFDPFLYLLMVA